MRQPSAYDFNIFQSTCSEILCGLFKCITQSNSRSPHTTNGNPTAVRENLTHTIYDYTSRPHNSACCNHVA
jgi:hypothetical protein